MRAVRTVIRLLAVATPLVGVTQAASDVLELGLKDFASTVGGESLLLAEFFAPWCGHCKALAPEYEKAATELRPDVKLAKVDCTVETELCAEYGVKGYPTLKVFRNGIASDYGGTRKADGIISYMKKQAMPAVSDLTASNHAAFRDADKIVIVAYLGANDGQVNQTFANVANTLRDSYLFGATKDAEAIKEAGVSAPAIVLYKRFDEKRNDFQDISGLTSDALAGFIKANSVPLVDEIGPDNSMVYYEANLPLAYLFVETDDQRKEFIPIIEPLAREYKGKMNFVHIDAVRFGSHAATLNLQATWPAFGIHIPKSGAKYPLPQTGELTSGAIQQFLQDYFAGKIEASMKSEPVPANQDGPVHILVADEFKKVVLDNDKDVFVEFYAPWCGYCKRLSPTWDDLGAKLSSLRDVLTIAKMDATANDIPLEANVEVKGFPTIVYYKRSGKSGRPVDYEGDRSLESLLEFISQTGEATKGKDIVSIAGQAPGHTPSEDEAAKDAAAEAAATGGDDNDDDELMDEDDGDDDDVADDDEVKAARTAHEEL